MTAPRNLTVQCVVDPSTSQQIFTAEGFGEYVRVNVTEVNGLDLSGETWLVGLGPYGSPAVDQWISPTVVLGEPAELGGPVANVQLYLFVGTPSGTGASAYNPPAGRWWPWVKLPDHPELLAMVCYRSVTTDGPPAVTPGSLLPSPSLFPTPSLLPIGA